MVRSGNSISQKQVADLQFVLFLFLSWQNHWNKFLLSYNVLNRYRKEFNRKKEGFGVLYCCVGCQWKEGQDYAKYIIDYCTERSIFPLVELYQNQESFFEQIQKTVPAVVLLALPGVSGLNAAEHLRSLYPGCGVIWCSDLDFSLHAFRLRVEYFFMEPVDEQKIREGFSVWLRHSKAM